MGFADNTAELTDAEFRAMVLCLVHANENQAQRDADWIFIARSRLTLLAPNKRGSLATSARVLREMCRKMHWEVTEESAKWSIRIENYTQDQGLAPSEPQPRPDETPPPTPTPISTPPHKSALSVAELLQINLPKLGIDPPEDLEAWTQRYSEGILLEGRDPAELLEQLYWLAGPNAREQASFTVLEPDEHLEKFDRIKAKMWKDGGPSRKREAQTKLEDRDRISRERDRANAMPPQQAAKLMRELSEQLTSPAQRGARRDESHKEKATRPGSNRTRPTQGSDG